MNYDRFLTRVWDRQEKRMMYSGDTFNYNDTTCIFKAINECLYYAVSCQSGTTRWNELYAIRLGEYSQCKDRFVPMMCTAAKTDDAKKLLYESDIIKYNNSLAIIKWDLYEGLYAEPLIYDDACIFHSTAFEACSYVGNRWENEKLLEVKA